MSRFRWLLAVITAALIMPSLVQAQSPGAVTGQVVSATTGEPLSAVQVFVEGTSYGTLTEADGRYRLTGVPAGTYAIVAQRIGFAAGRQENVRIRANATTTTDFSLRTHALAVQEVVVTGVVDPIAGTRLPFTVGRVTAEQMPVPAISSPLAALQGRVAGVTVVSGSGQPGSGASIQLRTPTSIVRSNNPLIVVDGVILGANVVDIESLDIESMEVVKGAAAASLYGSRAAGGVIQIRTQRGRDVATGDTRITARSEIGNSSLARDIPLTQHHYWEVDAQGQFVLADDPSGELSDRERRISRDVAIMDQPYGVETWNQLRQFYTPGQFQTHSATVSQNLESTNWTATVGHRREAGIIRTNDGLTQNSFRLNLDHRLRENFTLGFSGYHMRNDRDNLSGDPFWDLLMTPPDVNLEVRDEAGNFMMQPDPTFPQENPIWRQTSRDNNQQRLRTLANINARFTPLTGLSFQGDLSYDRSDRQSSVYVPKGTPTIGGLGLDGNMSMSENRTDQVNASLSSTYLRNFGQLTTRTTLRGTIEREHGEGLSASGSNFLFMNVPNIGATADRSSNSSEYEIRANGFFVHTGLDYAGRYIGDLLVRRDGSSLFGELDRWNTYYRASAAYRMAEEPWWPVQALSEFRLNYSIGTAGGRPNFSDRFETVSVSGTTGAISRSNLGNRFLRPEHTTEQEVGLLAILNDRYSLQLTYAHAVTEDQLIQMPQPAVTGFFAQWQNSGTITGNTIEATLEAQLLQTPTTTWSTNLIADRSRHKITEWNRPCYVSGITFRCEGETLGIYYGRQWVTGADQLPAPFADHADEFVVNDDGYMVWVGQGGDWRDGNWGETGTVAGSTVRWGHPVLMEDEAGNIATVRIGDRNPDFRLGWGNNLTWRGLSLYTLIDAMVGGEVYHDTKARLYQHDRHGDLDQAGKPAEERKPVQYYHTLYNAFNINSHFVEDASYMKVREVSLRYGLGGEQLERIGLGRLGTDRISLGVIGRNLLTLTPFSGFDPEVGGPLLANDAFGYPNFRTLTAFVEVQF